MSSFICSKYHFQSLNTTGRNEPTVKEILSNTEFNTDEKFSDFLEKLYLCNISSVITQSMYSDMLPAETLHNFRELEKGQLLTVTRFVGALKCVRYQIETYPPTYKHLENAINSLINKFSNFESEGWEVIEEE